MDKNILKKFAIESRQDLMDKIKIKIKTFYVEEDFSKEQKGDIYLLTNEKHSLKLTIDEYKKRELLIKRISDLSIEQVIEEAAYTWFNRIVAIRYMEINDMLPLTKNNESLGIRVLSSKDNTPDPEILKFTNLINPDLDIDFNKHKYSELQEEDKFKYILSLVCKKLGKVIPQVFDGITDYIDILIPDNLLNDTGFVTKIVTEVPVDNYNEVEIIGWLYQYYNQIEKDRVISAKKAYIKTEIPYATQLFTPDWIVKYMVENTLGRFNKNINLKYRISELAKIETDNIEKIKFCDPCCGSGHILIYVFEIFYKLYLEAGYRKDNICEKIINNNIFGLDIDERAKQLSILSLILKARGYDRFLFNKKIDIKIYALEETRNISEYCFDLIKNNENRETIDYLLKSFVNAKIYGSLLELDVRNYEQLIEEIASYKCKNLNLLELSCLEELEEKVIPLVKQAIILTSQFDIVITNPPYMGERYMLPDLKNYVKNNFCIGKSDLFSAFILRIINFTKKDGYVGLVSPYVWFFIKTYLELRKKVLSEMSFESCIQLEYNAFEAACVPVATYIMQKNNASKNGIYIKLSDFKGSENQSPKYLEAITSCKCSYKYIKNTDIFKKIPNNTFAYWIGDKTIKIYQKSETLSTSAVACVGLQTSDNKRFLREWYEVNFSKIGFNINNIQESTESKKKWFPYNKGGGYRKWYGNVLEVVNWENDGKDIRDYNEYLNSSRDSNIGIANTKYYFKESGTWGLISSSDFSVRYSSAGAIFDTAGSSIFCNKDLKYLIGLLNTSLVKELLLIQNPTLNFTPGNIANLPVIFPDEETKSKIIDLVDKNIIISKRDWDYSETSWDFDKAMLLKHKGNIKERISCIEKEYIKNCNDLKNNETLLNEEFVKIYEVEGEINVNVSDKELTLKTFDNKNIIIDFVSYAVGCMFGRYSLDEDGLAFAGGEFDYSKYKTFEVDKDNVIPITDEAYFSDDIVTRFKKFVETVYGKDTLNENLDYIANTLGKRGTETSEETIRRYFNNDFYADHIKTYQKKPIYWLFDSGKKNGFKCLIYLHRYNDGLVAKVRLDYLHRIQSTYEKLLTDVNYKLGTELSLNDKKEAQKRQIELIGKLQETKEYDEKISHSANQRISIDLDDGVTVNYEKFADILGKIN